MADLYSFAVDTAKSDLKDIESILARIAGLPGVQSVCLEDYDATRLNWVFVNVENEQWGADLERDGWFELKRDGLVITGEM